MLPIAYACHCPGTIAVDLVAREHLESLMGFTLLDLASRTRTKPAMRGELLVRLEKNTDAALHHRE